MIWNWSWIFGSAMAKDMAAAGCKGVAQHYLFDDYWPGSTATAEWKNMVGMLTEAASVNGATPLYIEKNEIKEEKVFQSAKSYPTRSHIRCA